MSTISWPDRTDSGAPTGATTEVSASVMNEIKSVVNANAAALERKLDADHPSVASAREWSADTVAQAEAEAGAATARRAWTAQRVRQAIGAWWNAITVGNDKLAIMAPATLKGRRSAGTGAPEDLTPAQARALLNVADGATANGSDGHLLSRANHTGTQPQSTVAGGVLVFDAGGNAAAARPNYTGSVLWVNASSEPANMTANLDMWVGR